MPTYAAPGVYVEEVESGAKPLAPAATAIAAFVGFTERAPHDDPADPDGVTPRLVTSWAQYQSLFGGLVPSARLPVSVKGFFDNGGGIAYIVRIPNSTPSEAPAALALPAAGQSSNGDGGGDAKSALEITAASGDIDGLDISIEPRAAAGPDGEVLFDLRVRQGGVEVEAYPGVTLAKGESSVETAVNGVSTRIAVKAVSSAKGAAPVYGRAQLVKSAPNPIAVSQNDFAGDEVARTGIAGLGLTEDVTILCVPDLVTIAQDKETGAIDLDTWKAVQTAMINHCEYQGNRMAILDPPPGLSAQKVLDWRRNFAMFDTKFAALYYPWITIPNPYEDSAEYPDKNISVPPCGHMAGIWARTDETRGVWKAPANETIAGVVDVQPRISKGEQELLNPDGVNCIRAFGTRGIRVWGARTLSSDSTWNYINVRRLFNMIETTILNGTNWAVFEPNEPELWSRVSRTVTYFLRDLWRQGALFGTTAQEAFFVHCDESTNPPESIDLGRMICEVGVSPVKPAEFVIFRVSQQPTGGAAAE